MPRRVRRVGAGVVATSLVTGLMATGMWAAGDQIAFFGLLGSFAAGITGFGVLIAGDRAG